MPHKRSKPAALGAGRLRNVDRLAADDIPTNNPTGPEDQARRAVNELVANGATFTIPHRSDGLSAFLYALPRGGDIERCRAIIRQAKASGFYDRMVRAIVDLAQVS